MLKVALLGDVSTGYLSKSIRKLFKDKNQEFELFEAEYDQIDIQVKNIDSELHAFDSDYVVIYMSSEKLLKNFYELDVNNRTNFAETISDELSTYWEKLSHLRVVQFNFVMIPQKIYGNTSFKFDLSFEYQIRKLNLLLAEKAFEKNIDIVDIDQLQSQIGRSSFFNTKQYYLGDIAISSDYSERVAKEIVNIISVNLGSTTKAVILDLDNTLWGGVVADEGINRIQLGSLGVGKVYTDIQKYMLELKKRGIILCICSKNDIELAKEPFEKHPDMILKLEDISVFCANWQDKASNVREIKEILNIGYDSIVFIDDNPFERNIVREFYPDVKVPELPKDPSKYLEFLISENLFETLSVSSEDAKRTTLYKEEALRVQKKKTYLNIDDYLRSLHMICSVEKVNEYDLPRISQLTMRSNQFNLRTFRYTEQDIKKFYDSKKYELLAYKMKDDFGDYGLVGVVILEYKSDTAFIDTFIMSCRVLKRGMEQFISNNIIEKCSENNIRTVLSEYIPTRKNSMVKNLYNALGYEMLENNHYKIEVMNYNELPCEISRDEQIDNKV